MMDFRYNYYYNYFQLLNKSLLRKKEFHIFLSIIDIAIILFKILNIYISNYNNKFGNINKYISPSIFFRNYSIFIRLLPIMIYLIFVYLILIIYLSCDNNKKINRIDIIIINIFEHFFIRISFIFFCEFIFCLPSLYFILFFVLSIPFIFFIFINLYHFHLGKFMVNSISFPYDEFTSINDILKTIIKILISILSISTDVNICKYVYFLQYILLVIFCLYNTYLVFYKSYYLMNNELYDKCRYSNILSIAIIETFVYFMEHKEVYETLFIIIVICIYIFTTILVLISYDPYKYIIIDNSENNENIYYYFFLLDRNKNISFYLLDKIEDHISRCGCCSLCLKYKKFYENKNVIELINDKNNNKDTQENDIDEDNEDIFNILYNEKNSSLILINQLINCIKKLGYNFLCNNSYFTIKFTYIYYYSLKFGDITLALNMILLFDLILENNQNLISNDKIIINQIININEFLILYKEILSQIKEIISKNMIKRYIDKFFELAKKIKKLDAPKFKKNLFIKKIEGNINYSYTLNICSLLYEEIFNKSISNHSMSIRENPQFIDDMLKNFGKQNNNIILNFNLKTIECKILSTGLDLIDYINKSFYDLFPNQIKEILIKNFRYEILDSNQKNSEIQDDKNTKSKAKKSKEISIIIQNHENNTNYSRILYLKLNLLFNYCINENILLTGYFIIHKNTIMTIKIKDKNEKIIGFGTKEIMNISYKIKFNYQRFLESDFMKNKQSDQAINISLNNNDIFMYTISENKNKQKKKKVKSCFSIQSTILEEIKLKKGKTKKHVLVGNIIENALSESENQEEDITENENIINSQKVKNLLEDNNSQSSALTKSSLSSFWNINKAQAKDIQNNFTSRKFFKLQILLVILLLLLLVLIIVLIMVISKEQRVISDGCNKYLDLIQFIRFFLQFSVEFLTVVCVEINEDECKSYISQFDTKDFNQTLFFTEQNEILAEYGSDSINKLIINSESIKDEILLNLLKGNFSYYLVSKKKVEGKYNITSNIISISFNDVLLLTSNNMRILVSPESRLKNRNKEPIYLLSGFDEPFSNIKNLDEDLSEYQISAYTYIMNFRRTVFRFTTLNQRFHALITKRNNDLLNFIYILHNIIFIVMIFQIIILLIYIYTYNSVLAEIINSIIAKLDIIFDNENDFKKIYTRKINLLESLVNEKNYNPGHSIISINKNCNKYENLIGINKKTEQKLNVNKKYDNKEEKPVLYKDNQKFINWIDIYNRGYDKFYINFVIITIIIDIIVYGVFYGIWKSYESKSTLTFNLIKDSWDFERQTLRIISFYHHMIFMNQTLDNISDDYFSDNNYSCVENFLIILTEYNRLRRKKESTDYIKSYKDFCNYNCLSLFDFMGSRSNIWLDTLKIINIKYGLDINNQKQRFIQQCENTKTFVVDSVTTSFQGFYQKCFDEMITFNDRSYEGLIDKLFNHQLPNLTSTFLNVTRYILYIIGKVAYSEAFEKILKILGNIIITSLIIYISVEILLFIFFFFVYIWNINIECKNIYILKKVFEVTNLNDE